jgi:nucleotide-binding universal stress UspA family protein
MQLNKILVGTDFSRQADLAVRHALDIARHSGAELILAHAGTVPPARSTPRDPLERYWTGYHELALQSLADKRNRLEELRERITGQGAEVSQVLIDAFPDTGLCEAADELDVDLVVVGTHGNTGIRRFLLGSVAERVVRLCKKNVLVARGNAPIEGYRRILVPTDFSDAADRALQLATLIAPAQAHIDVVYFWQLPATASIYAPTREGDAAYAGLRESIQSSAIEHGNELIEGLARPGLSLRFRTGEQAAASGILDQLVDEDYDLVTMGSHGRRFLSRALLGSVSEKTVRHAPCPVAVVHPEQSE